MLPTQTPWGGGEPPRFVINFMPRGELALKASETFPNLSCEHCALQLAAFPSPAPPLCSFAQKRWKASESFPKPVLRAWCLQLRGEGRDTQPPPPLFLTACPEESWDSHSTGSFPWCSLIKILYYCQCILVGFPLGNTLLPLSLNRIPANFQRSRMTFNKNLIACNRNSYYFFGLFPGFPEENLYSLHFLLVAGFL